MIVNKATDQFSMFYHEYHRYAKFEAQMFSVIDASQKFISIYNGYIGIAPYADGTERKNRNFLW